MNADDEALLIAVFLEFRNLFDSICKDGECESF